MVSCGFVVKEVALLQKLVLHVEGLDPEPSPVQLAIQTRLVSIALR